MNRPDFTLHAIETQTRSIAADLKLLSEKVTVLEADFAHVSGEFRGTSNPGRGSLIERLLAVELALQSQADRLERFSSLTRKAWLAVGMTTLGAIAQALATAWLLRP